MNSEIISPFENAVAGSLPPRRKFSVTEMYRLVEAGILGHDERVELIDGEIVQMSPKGVAHEVLKTRLMLFWADSRTPDVLFTTETTFHLDEHSYLEPDFVFYESEVGLQGLNGETALLAVEVADSSLAYDLGLKQQIYARYGVRELWVIDARKLVAYIFLEPGRDGYAAHSIHQPSRRLAPDFAPEFAVTLDKLGLELPEKE